MMSKILKYLAVAVFLLPLFASADFTATPAPTLKRVGLVLTVNGQVSKGSYSTQKGTPLKLEWTTVSGTKGCVNNWDSAVTSTGSSEGIVTSDRTFIITCYGVGAAQAAKVQVRVAFPDLTVTGLKVSGLAPVLDAKGKAKKSTYKAGSYALEVTVKNSGQIDIVKPFSVIFQTRRSASDFKAIGNELDSTLSVYSLKKGESKLLKYTGTSFSSPNDPRFFRAEVDGAKGIDEGTKENNNFSNIAGPVTFE